jgi:hypothetical protein
VSDVPERVGAHVSVFIGIGKLAGSHGIEHDDAGPRHVAILGRAVLDVLGLIGMVIFIACVIALAASVTWLVVKYSPMKKTDETAS